MVKIQNLHKTFSQKQVLRGINLICEKGKSTFIIGASGGGKSVLVKHFIGLLRPDEGTVEVDGVDIAALRGEKLKNLRKRFGYLFQDAALFDSMTVFDNVAFPLVEHTAKSKNEIKDIVREKLALVGLTGIENNLPSELSGGMRKRVGLARAIVLDPEIILYDEPTTGLDPVMSNAIDELIINTTEHLKATSVVISHDIASTFKIADKIAMLYEGTIIEEGTPEEIKNSKHKAVQDFLSRSKL